MHIEFVGGAQTVTGSKHLVHTAHGKVLLDCGLFQGRRAQSNEINKTLGFRAGDIDYVVLSHAHIDHSGALPLLCKQGFRGAIYATPATRDLIALMLEDSAAIAEADARYINHRIERDGSDMEPVEPLYTAADVEQVLSQVITIAYRHRHVIVPGIELTFLDAGHVLGSAIVVLDLREDGKTERLVFSGDLGRRGMPILRDPEIPTGANYLLLESTYGDREHPALEEMHDQLAALLTKAHARGGKIIIPSFALERAQEVLFAIHRLLLAKRIPAMPVYVDSPLTIRITDVFKLHPECYDAHFLQALQQNDPFEFEGLRYTASVEESKEIGLREGPCVIISASGMAEAGRVLHHLRGSIENPKDMVIIIGFQAQHTLGRRLVEGRSEVKIFGVRRDVRAQVAVLNGFSAHADRSDLIDFAEAVRARGQLRAIALVHGELPAQESLRDALLERHFPTVLIPASGEVWKP